MADTWEVISGYSATNYVDTMTFEVDAETKKLAKLSGQTLVAGEKNSQYIRIKMPRYWDGIDISEMNIGIIYDLNNGEYFGTTQAISAERTTDSIRFGWVVPGDACAVKGTLLFVIIVKGTNYILKTQIAETPVVKSLSEDGDIPEPTREIWYENFRVRVETAVSDAENAISEAKIILEQARSFVGSPLVAETAAAMVDTERIYVYTGSESGYTSGNWYYYNTGTSAWTSGGVYNAVAVDTDTTLTIAGKAADAKKTGDEIGELKSGLKNTTDAIYAEMGVKDVNFFDTTNKFNAYINGASTIAVNNSNRLAWAQLQPETAYTLTVAKKANTDMQIMLCNTQPEGGVVGINKVNLAASDTSVAYNFTTTDTYIYIAFKYWATSATTYTEAEVLDSISIKMAENIFDRIQVVEGELPDDILVKGGVNSTTGKIGFDSDVTMVTPTFIDERVKSATPNSGYYIAIFGYHAGSFKGCLNDSKQFVIGSWSVFRVKVSLDELREQYPGYQFRVMLGKIDGTGTNLRKNVVFEYSTMVTDATIETHDITNAIQQAQNNRTNSTVPISFLHFSDIHGNGDRLQDIVNYISDYSPYIADSICTGDIVGGQYSDGIDFWSDVSGAENILTCIGNHDALTSQSGGTLVSMADLCAMFITPFVSNWGTIVHPTDTTYYYKDYTTNKVRLIVLDCMHDDATQLSWLQDALADAKTNNLHVIIGIHYPAYPRSMVECDFSPAKDLNNFDAASISANILSAVDDFQTSGGYFVCYLTGHEHTDFILTPQSYPNQLVIGITCATNVFNQWYKSDQYRFGDFSNAVNFVTINTVDKTVSIKRIGADMDMFLRDRKAFCYDYGTHTLLN